MSARLRLGIASKFNALALTLILATSAGITLFVIRQMTADARQGLLAHGRSLAAMVAQNSEYAIYTENEESIRHLIGSLAVDPDLAYVEISNTEGRVLTSRHLWPDLDLARLHEHEAVRESRRLIVREIVNPGNRQRYIDIIAPVVTRSGVESAAPSASLEPIPGQARVIGHVHLGFSQSRIRTQVDRFLSSTVLFTSILLLVGIGLTLVMTRAITSPVKRLARAANEIATGNLETPVAVNTRDELADLGSALNRLLQWLREYRDQVSSHRETLERTVEERTDALKVAMERAYELAHKAEEASRAKSQFLANMSHEIRTPMNGIVGMTDLLLTSGLTPQQLRLADTVRRSAETLLDIINDILDLSKIEAGKLELDSVDFDLRETVADVVELLANRAHSKGLELAYDVDDQVPTAVRGDPGRLRQILTNLIGNAIKFTERGEVFVGVGVAEATADSAVLRFEVRDTGIGIAPEIQERIFGVFLQGDSSTTRRFGGSGLGLPIAKQLAEMMGGSISVQSALGQGSTFFVTMRLTVVRGSTPLPRERGRDLQGLRILIVDDNATNRSILCHQIGLSGMRHESAAGAEEALAILRAAATRGESYDLAILDMNMPGVHGLELARIIRADPHIASVRLVLLTSGGMCEDPEEARRAGIDAYLTKPVRQSALSDCLRGVMGSGAEVSPSLAPPPGGPVFPARVLLAEDNEVNRDVAVRMLERLGSQVDVVTDGRQAVQAVQAVAYDLVLMDCQMPEMDGFTAARAIRDLEQRGHVAKAATGAGVRHLPIVALTAYALTGDREQCLAAGMDDYLSKPFTLNALRAVLARWLPGPSGAESSPAPGLASPAGLRAPTDGSGRSPLDPTTLANLRALQRADRPNVLARLLSLYLAGAPQLVDDIRNAVSHADASMLRQAAHDLKSTSGNIGARRLADLSVEVERLGRSGDTAGASNVLPALVSEFEVVREAVTALLAKESPAR